MATRTGQSVAAVLDAPYGLTLWTFVQLQDADRIQALRAAKDRLDLARYVAFAMWKPNELTRIEKEVLRGGDPGAPSGMAVREARLTAAARAILAARRQRLRGSAHGPPGSESQDHGPK